MTFEEFSIEINRYLDIDLSSYKEKQMKRRITTLMNRYDIYDYRDYLRRIQEDKIMLEEFIDRLTINVTEFFRNANRWEILKDKILPEIFAKKNHLNIWSAACSTGEEPYTLLIILNELGRINSTRVVATDIDNKALELAKTAVYNEKAVKEVPKDLVSKYFTKEERLYKLNSDLKMHANFYNHDLLKDKYPRSDLIICRNVLIYFTEEAKKQIYAGFSEALNAGGVLFVGSTEQIFNASQIGFKSIDSFFYQKI